MIAMLPQQLRLTPEEVTQRRAAMLYVSERLSLAEWSRDPDAKWVLRREFSNALSEILKGEHLPYDWTFA